MQYKRNLGVEGTFKDLQCPYNEQEHLQLEKVAQSSIQPDLEVNMNNVNSLKLSVPSVFHCSDRLYSMSLLLGA